MRLLFITDLYPSHPNDQGATLALHYYTRQWVRDGHHVEVVNIHSPNILEVGSHYRRQLPKAFVLDDVKVSNKTMLRLPGEVIIYPRFNEDYISQFDAVAGHLPRGARLAYMLCCKYYKPFILGIHFTDYKRSKVRDGKLTRQYEEMLAKASFINFRSYFLKEEFEKAVPKISTKSEIMPGGVNNAWLDEHLSRDFSKTKAPKLLTVSKLNKHKNIDIVIESFRLLKSKSLKYVIVGEGNELSRLKNLAKDANIDFVGSFDNEGVRDQMDASDIFIMVSVEETFGLVYLEAMARGCITIGTKGEGIDGVIINGENGFLCEPNRTSVVETLEHVLSLTSDERAKISQAAMATAWHYSYSSLASSFMTRVEEAISLN